MIDVIAAAQSRVYSPDYRDRAWLTTACGALLQAGTWAELGGLAVHVALAAALLRGDLAAQISARAQAPVAGADWTSAAWVAPHLTALVAALVADGSDLQDAGLSLAAAVSRVSL